MANPPLWRGFVRGHDAFAAGHRSPQALLPDRRCRRAGRDPPTRYAEGPPGDQLLGPHLTALLALLGAPVDDTQWRFLEPSQRRQRTLDAVKRLFLRESRVQPLLLIVEDLHWIDTETQALLDSVVESLPSARVLLVVTYRPDYQHGWGSKSSYDQVRLHTLSPESAAPLLGALLGGDAALEPPNYTLITR